MCPGGKVVEAASEENTVVVNGMSNYLRDGKNSNAALVVSVLPEDCGSGLFDGMNFQSLFVELTADIDMNAGWTVIIDEQTGKISGKAPKNIWTPIGGESTSVYFNGKFNGNGHTIKNLNLVQDYQNGMNVSGLLAEGRHGG